MWQTKLQKQQLNLYDRLSKTGIIGNQFAVKLTSTLTKNYLMNVLNNEMHGIQRFPTMWYDYPNHSMEDLNLSCYKILPNEAVREVPNYTTKYLAEASIPYDQ